MGSAGTAIGPDGKPIKKQVTRPQMGGPRGGGIQKPFGGRGGMPMGGGPMRGPMGPMGPGFGPGRPGPYGMGPPGGFGGRGPMGPPYGGPMGGPGGNMGMGYGPGPGPRDPNISFFGGPPQPVPPMGDARTGPMQSGQQQVTPSPATVGKGPVAAGNASNASNNKAAASSSGGEVPGFGTNSSIHELFGKMIWKKMEGLKDESVIDQLQNRIMNMIHEALAEQAKASSGGAMNGHSGFKSF